MTDLLIDVGNSRIKWAINHAGILSAHGAAVHLGSLPAEVSQAWQQAGPPARVIAANVAGGDYAQLLEDWVQRQWSLAVEYVAVDPEFSDLKLAYADPTKLGVDRWLALIAARGLSSTDVAVIDIGTAMTMDLLSAQGQHLGGIIIPGLSLMQQSLQQKTHASMPSLDNTVSGVLGADTATGIACGSLYAVAGAIEHLLAKVEAQTAGQLSVIIGGGDAEIIQAELSMESRHVPDLVLQGIKIFKGACE